MIWSCVHLWTVASFFLVSALLIVQLPIAFREVLRESCYLVTTDMGIPLLEIEEQLHGVGSNEGLPDKFVLTGFPRNEDRSIEVGPTSN